MESKVNQYVALVKYVLKEGKERDDRTGVGTISTFGYQTRYDMRNGFPLLTTKKVNFKSIIAELLWFLSGSTNINDLKAIYPTKIWNDWADENGDLGPVYGAQWRKWTGFDDVTGHGDISKFEIDQISNIITQIKNNPYSRRLIVNAWNVAEIENMALPPCHCFFQLYVDDGFLDLQLYQRSADVALGVPYNLASYSALLTIIANECNLTPRYFIHTFGDVHIYTNHVMGLMQQIKREPRPLPTIEIKRKPLYDLTLDDFAVHHYYPHDPIKFDIAV